MNPGDLQDLLAETGRFYLMLESHQNAVRFCRNQLRELRQRLAEAEQAALQAQQPS